MAIRIKHIVLLIGFLCPVFLIAQKSTGDKYYEKLEYAEAIKYYKKDYEKNNDRESLSRLADCYYKTHNYSEALKYFQELEKTGLNTSQLFCVAQLYMENDQPEKGKEYLRQYAAASGSEWWKKIINDPDFLKEENNTYFISNQKYLNTTFSEFCVINFNEELLFTSDRPASVMGGPTYGGTSTPFLNMYETKGMKFNDSTFSIRSFYNRPDVSSHAGPAVWDSTNSILYFTFVNDKVKSAVNKASIYQIKKEGKKWGKATPLSFCSGNHSYGHPALYKNILIFASDKPDGQGGKDLYYVTINESSEPNEVKPVPGINTPGDEVFPSIRILSDGTARLYFSSNGFPSKGGLDIYSIAFSTETSAEVPVTWHKELSSSHDDFGISFTSSSQGYFSSDRSGGAGADDIYFFIENPSSLYICLEALKNEVSLAYQKVLVKKDNGVLDTAVTDENGCIFLHRLPEGANALQLLSSGEDLRIKTFEGGPKLQSKLVILDQSGNTIAELNNVDGKLIEQKIRTLWVTDQLTGLPAKGIKIEVRSINGKIIETIITDENGKVLLKKIPPGEKFILAIDADEIYPEKKNSGENDFGILITDINSKPIDSINSTDNEIKISVVKIKTLDLCLYNQITGEPLAHYTLTLRAADRTPIDTVITDVNGCYRFKKLPEGELILTIENYDGGALKVKIAGINESGVTSLIIKNSDGVIIESYGGDGKKKSRTFCIYDKKTKEPLKKILVHLADEKHKIIDSVYTGTDGCFTYEKLNDDDRLLSLILAADEAEFYVKGLEDKTEEKVRYSVYSDRNELLDSISSSSNNYGVGVLLKLIISGCLTSKTDGKPLAYTKVYFKNSNGDKIDSTMTDQNGCFKYKKLGGQPVEMQVMNVNDVPFVFNLDNETTVIPNKLLLKDRNNNVLVEIDPSLNFKKSHSKESLLCFYNEETEEPVTGMTITILEDNTYDYLTTSNQGCINYNFLKNKKYKLIIPSEKVTAKSAAGNETYQLEFSANDAIVNGNFTEGSEVIVKVGGIKYITASFKYPDGEPVENLPVEWFDAKTKSWSVSLTNTNGISKHVFNKNDKEVKVRVKESENTYNLTTEPEISNGMVKLMDENGQLLSATNLSNNKSFTVIVRPIGTDKGEFELKGAIASVGDPVNGATIYLKTKDGILIQRTTSDQDGNYYFKKLQSSSLMLEIDTTDIRMKFKTRIELNGTLISSTGKKLAGEEIILSDGTGLKLELQTTDANGNFSFVVDLDKIYSAIENSKDDPWKKLADGINSEITLNTIYFDYDKWSITFESERELDKAVKFLKDRPQASLTINAHTDSRGGDNYNLILSRKRARSVMNYFNSHGIDTMRLMSFGYGETKLINNCGNHASCSDALHKKNRRIEFAVSWNGTAHNTNAASPLFVSDQSSNPVNTETNNTTISTNSSGETGRWYKIQILTSGHFIECTKANFKGLDNVEYYMDKNIYKFTVGKFATKEEAITYRKKVIDLYPQAFPVILEDGKRVKE